MIRGLMLVMLATLVMTAKPAYAVGLCADDSIPAGMAVVSTGSSSCGTCRAREAAPISGQVMTICANQSIPDGYKLSSIQSDPKCLCVGSSDNAYVIEKVSADGAP